MKKTIILATVSTLALSGAAAAQSSATAMATTDLNMRTGAGPNFEVTGVIPAEGEVTVERCLEAETWCEVTYDGMTGWAYAAYLAAPVEGETVVVTEAVEPLEITTVVRENVAGEFGATLTGVATGAIAGALLAGPLGAAAGTAAAVGAAAGGVVGADVEVADDTITYIQANPVEPVYLDGEVVVGAGVPEGVEIYTIPDAEYQYANVNGEIVVLNADRRVVRIVQ